MSKIEIQWFQAFYGIFQKKGARPLLYIHDFLEISKSRFEKLEIRKHRVLTTELLVLKRNGFKGDKNPWKSSINIKKMIFLDFRAE